MSCSAQAAPTGPRTPIRVNGVAISRALISRETQNHPASTPVEAWRAAALALVVREALTQEVRRLGVEAEPIQDGEGRRETADEARMRALVEREAVTPTPTEAECRRYFEANARRFRSPDLLEVSHILICADPADEAARKAARMQAVALIAELRDRPDTFEDLARLYSACPSSGLGGSLGQIGRGQTVPAFEAAAFALRQGEISEEPVETRYGFHVIRLERRIDGRPLPFELVEGRIAAYLREAVTRRAQAQYVARLLARCEIEGVEVPGAQALNVN